MPPSRPQIHGAFLQPPLSTEGTHDSGHLQTQANNGEEAESTIIIRLDATDEKHNGARKVEQESDEPAD